MFSTQNPSVQVSNDPCVKVADLVDRPGASRRVEFALAVPEGFELPLVTVQEPLRLSGVIESVVDGLLVRAELVATLTLECARCLEPVMAEVRSDVVELYTDPLRLEPDDVEPEEGYEIVDAHIDLDPALRDALAPIVPTQPLCDDACAGLCPTCGTNRNEADCACVDERRDPRWAALEGLDLPDER